MSQIEKEASEPVRAAPSSPHGGLLPKTPATDTLPGAPTIGASDHLGRHPAAGRGPLFRR